MICKHLTRYLLAIAATLPASASERGPLPPADVWPRTKTEWNAQSQEEWRNATMLELVPDLWKIASGRMTAIHAKYATDGVIFDTALANALVDELWVDTGHPSLNNGVQCYVLGEIQDVAQWPDDRLPDAARAALVDGLLEFVDNHGGQETPAEQARVAHLLSTLAYGDPHVDAVVDALLQDSLEWATTVDSDVQREAVERAGRAFWGDAFDLMLLDRQMAQGPTTEALPAQYVRAVKALAELLQQPSKPGPDELDRLRTTTEAALVKLNEQRLSDDLISRLLIVYRSLLDRRPLIAPRTAYYIENQLLLLSSKERLGSDQNWGRWSQAVRALGPERISKRFRGYLSTLAARKDLTEPQRRATEAIRLALDK